MIVLFRFIVSNPPFDLLVRGYLETPRKEYVIDLVLGCFPEFEEKILFLKIAHTVDTGLRGIVLELTWKPSP